MFCIRTEFDDLDQGRNLWSAMPCLLGLHASNPMNKDWVTVYENDWSYCMMVALQIPWPVEVDFKSRVIGERIPKVGTATVLRVLGHYGYFIDLGR